MKYTYYLILLSIFILSSCGENNVEPLPPDGAPTNLVALLIDGNSIQLTWQDNSDGELGFLIQRKIGTGNFSDLTTTQENTEIFIDSLLTSNTGYQYRVAAHFGNSQSDWSNTASQQTPIDPLAPSDLRALSVTNSLVSLRWNDNSSDETGFILQRRIGNSSFQNLAEFEPEIVNYQDVDIIPGSAYGYRVAASRPAGLTDWSNILEVTVPPLLTGLFFGSDSTFEIMTWNIEHFPKNDLTTVSYAAEIIQTLDIDLIALQEIESYSYFNNLLAALPGWDGYRASSAAYSINLAYLYKIDTINIGSIFEIYEDDWYAFPRSPLVMEFTYNGVPFVSINNHLKAGGSNDDEIRRREASENLEQYIAQFYPYSNVIMLGDLNDEIQEPEADNVFWNFIQLPALYKFTDMAIAQGSYLYWSYPTYPSHIDHILITNELFDEFEHPLSEVLTIRIDHYLSGGWSEYNSNVSDHRPVALKLYVN
ncbi:MAG: endonuclease/exonuclease/phosphatase family protein [Candidatus Cloacimonetes bacterium]|nr:endonuclease/exonuclease/phosphatase family protein [Candidatus Cloacimonadota bacterium]